MWHYYNRVMHYTDSLDKQDWFLLLLCVVVIGAICMRGFGSRAKY